MEVRVGHFSPTPYVARGLKSELQTQEKKPPTTSVGPWYQVCEGYLKAHRLKQLFYS